MIDTKPLGRGLSSLIPQKRDQAVPSSPKPVAPLPAPLPPVVAPARPVPPVVVSAKVEPLPVVLPDGTTMSKRMFDIPTSLIDPNPHQPRHHIQEETLDELVQSIKQHGILQPLIVTKNGTRFQLIAG